MKHTILAVSLAAILAACGGGSDSPASTVNAPDRTEAPRLEAERVEAPKIEAPSKEDEPRRARDDAPVKAQEVEPQMIVGHIRTTPDEKLESSWFSMQDAPTARQISDAYFTVFRWLATDREEPNDAEQDAVGHLMYWYMTRKAVLESEIRHTYASCAILKQIEDETFQTMLSSSPRQFATYMRNAAETSRDIIGNPQNHEDEVSSYVNYGVACAKKQ